MATTHPVSCPSLGTGTTGSARREALRAFADSFLTLDGDMNRVLAQVDAGPAPQGFKDEFRRTLEALCDTMTSVVNS